MAHPWEKSRPISAWLPGGYSTENEGKVSRNLRPIIDGDKCIKCNFCWIYCPDGCVSRGDTFSINYGFCKGCGVCATECPQSAITMVKEVEA